MLKYTTRLFLIIFVAMMSIFLIANLFGFYFGQEFRDFYTQHLNFINYFRMNFYQTHELFPQFNMNMGLGQSMVTLFYHGFLNPFVLISFIVPFIPTEIYFEMMIACIIALTVSSCYALLSLHKFHHNIKLIVSVMCGFSFALIYHGHYHPMFIYYIPFAFLNLIFLHRLVNNNKSVLFTLSFLSIFFFNFFFAPIIMVINTLYFLYLVKNKRKKFQAFRKYAVANIIGILCGFVITLPQFIAFLETARSGVENQPGLLDLNYAFPFAVLISPYYLGIGLVGFCALFYFLLKRQNKLYFCLSLIILVFCISDFVNYILNVGQYIHYKQLIYTIPFFAIIMAAFLEEDTKLKYRMAKIVGIFTIVCFVVLIPVTQLEIIRELVNMIHSYTVFRLPLLALILAIILFVVYIHICKVDLKEIRYRHLLTLCFLVAALSFTIFGSFYEGRWFANITDTTCPEEAMVYTSEDPTNKIECINESSPGYFTSIINQEYIDFFKGNTENSSYGNERFVYNESFNNPISQQVFIENDFIYGQNTSDLYQGTTTSTFQMYYYDTVQNGEKTKQTINPDLAIPSYTFDEDFVINDIPSEGVLAIRFDQENNICNTDNGAMCSITINGVKNEDVTVATHQTLIDHTTFTYFIDLEAANNQLVIEATPGTWVLENIEIYYLDDEELNQKKTYTSVDNLVIDYNNGYSFDITMEEDGYIISTLVYDENFTITIDGEEVEKEKVNGTFLGCQITEGTHHVEITYQIKGFNLALITSICGFTALFVLFIIERRAR